jgi:hypothetical protein
MAAKADDTAFHVAHQVCGRQSQGNALAGQSGKLLKPRLSFLTRRPFEQCIGLICLLLAVILFLPIPFGNNLPALAICLFAFALLERDGLAAMIGVVVAILSAIIVCGVLYALLKSAIFVITNALALPASS